MSDFRVAVSGDWHYGLRVEELDRTPEIHKAANFVVDEVIRRQVNLFVINGDLTDDNTPHPELIALLIELLWKLERAEVPTVINKGNHEATSAPGRLWGLTPLQRVGYKYIQFMLAPGALTVDGQRCLFLPHVTRAQAVAEGYETPQAYLDAFVDEQVCGYDKPMIAFTHLNVDGARSGTEELMLRQSSLQVPALLRRSSKVSRVINSHIHTPQEVDKVIMPGSIVSTDFGDVDANKGFIVGDLAASGRFVYERIKTPQSPLEEFELDFTEWDQAKAKAQIAKLPGKLTAEGAIVKVRLLIAEENLPAFDDTWVYDAFAGKCEAIKTIDKIIARSRAVRDEGQQPDLKPEEAVKRYLDRRKPDGADRKLRLALRLIEEGAHAAPEIAAAPPGQAGSLSVMRETLARIQKPAALPTVDDLEVV